MKSKQFSKFKRLRAKTRCVQKEVEWIKGSRRRHIRRAVKSILKATHTQENVEKIQYVNDGSWRIV